MDNKLKYEMLADGESVVSSSMGIIPMHKGFAFSEDSIKSALKSSKYFKLVSFDKQEDDRDTYYAEIEYCGTSYEVKLFVEPVKNIGLNDFSFANQIDENDLKTAQEQSAFLSTSLFFGDNILESFHLQLKIMDAIVPEASLVLDFMSYRLLSAKWLKMTAKSDIPPSPDYLFSLHGVYSEDKGTKQYWFHTHGLLRCRSIELEILGVTAGPEQMNDLINMVVKKFIKDPSRESEKFQIGYDGLGLHLAWLRWEEALKDLPDDVLGGMKDREGNVHTEPAGVLFAVEDNILVSPEIFVKTLADNPIFYISNEETQRMSDLARERFPIFKSMFEKTNKVAPPKPKSFLSRIFGKDNTEAQPSQEPWDYIVKLGLTVDDATTETEKEHLWFRVSDLQENLITCELLNQPYWIAALSAGSIGTYPMDLLTDWVIYSPQGGSYSPDSAYRLGTM
ncbi:DUF4026 domain-containing protein [Dysgonomonas sp. 216]|uniref:DUF4026 domain-containing protein n=1 Tax=Dysgonomonas sp. 216 TaxID=2302934 RepID=UPI0013D08672|nr:DUF4026 domain-containing protein [Dysgonomonas sp. 216]NDW18457.1 DUF4026 domain-containing protein [Dysgonomonas sp. 216]